uniref:Uncharacterized protein n=1 Tax=Lactuca sativa TaxID=4236 RepID=A0A9R1X4K6_LACSA|nr:hypothetical protein LSAT_V11C700368080 [Lactuca sativa]
MFSNSQHNLHSSFSFYRSYGLVFVIAEIQQGHPDKSKHRLDIRIQDAKLNQKWYYQAYTNYFGKAVPSDESDAHQTKSSECHNENCTKTTTSIVPCLAIKIIYDYIFLDTISCMDDNITPSTIDKNKTTSPMKSLKTTPVLKRNMEEVFDLDLNDHLSSSKTPKVYPNCPKKIVVKGKVGEK